jgi:hypothetical protein
VILRGRFRGCILRPRGDFPPPPHPLGAIDDVDDDDDDDEDGGGDDDDDDDDDDASPHLPGDQQVGDVDQHEPHLRLVATAKNTTAARESRFRFRNQTGWLIRMYMMMMMMMMMAVCDRTGFSLLGVWRTWNRPGPCGCSALGWA